MSEEVPSDVGHVVSIYLSLQAYEPRPFALIRRYSGKVTWRQVLEPHIHFHGMLIPEALVRFCVAIGHI